MSEAKPVTPRGFRDYAQFQMNWHGLARVRQSSIAFQGPCVWVFTELSYSNQPVQNPPTLHLNYNDALQLRDALTLFLEETVQEYATHEEERQP